MSGCILALLYVIILPHSLNQPYHKLTAKPQWMHAKLTMICVSR